MPPASEYRGSVKALLDDDVVAHNVSFDLRMVDRTWPGTLGRGGIIRTLSCARQLWPIAPGHLHFT
jgi:DNA polymerase III epsilon subunit-like protein